MAPAPPASESKSPEADCDEDAAGEWTLVSRKKKWCSSPNPARTASPEPDQEYLKTARPGPDQGHLMAAIQMLDSPKTQMQHHCNEQ
ncbi:hypothetical protein E2C01_066351 [Portunus trituberculatus]|uniref:Uncharacterized protein n=1 Tax=Portunus trituberculatus TaxID=210409 RepID=A0A5B7HTL7_PORTR|nr:hypothetical protein [Portunus trituberculatus]